MEHQQNSRLAFRIRQAKLHFPTLYHELLDSLIENAYLSGKMDGIKELDTPAAPATVPEGQKTT